MTEQQDLLKEKLQREMECVRCGNCCTMTTPIIVLPEDLERIAYQYHQTWRRAMVHFTKVIDTKTGLRGIKHTRPCMFYDPKIPGCKIYEIRPKICQDAPFKSQTGNDVDPVYYHDCPGSKKALGVE